MCVVHGHCKKILLSEKPIPFKSMKTLQRLINCIFVEWLFRKGFFLYVNLSVLK